MKIFIKSLLKTTTFIFFLPIMLFAQVNNITAAIDSKLIPLKSVEVSGNLSDLKPLEAKIDDKRIFLMGEATHGTHEFFTTKQRLVQFLVNELNYKVFVIEGDMAGAEYMNDYIGSGKGAAKNALEKMAIGVWMNQDFVNLIEWMKSYNENKKKEDKIKFYGCDMQFAVNSGQMLLDGAIKLVTSISEKAKLGLQVLTKYNYGKIENSELSNLAKLEAELKNAVVEEKDPILLGKFQRYIRGILQTLEYSKAKYLYDKDVIRDKSMAENVESIYEEQGMSKMIVWAHNFHVSKDFTMNKNLPMGSYISSKFPKETYVMGFSFNCGSFRAFNTQTNKYGECIVLPVTNKNSIETFFSKCSAPNFILDFNSSKNNSLINSFLNQQLYSRGIGGVYDPKKQLNGRGGTYQKLIKMYDGIVFINATTMTVPL
ncbi:erythromycin esterase [Pedobacter sp. UYP24]